MTPFLQQVARIYAANEARNLIDYCFVFPNKRSATFFSHYLRTELAETPTVLPHITNISDFVGEFSELAPANRYDKLFTLYKQYRSLPNVDVDFDRFMFWGEMLLSDFDDVDLYLVDADALFVNIQRLREISSNFLTEDQLEVIKHYWGEDRSFSDIDSFWRHVDTTGQKVIHDKFLKLWQVLQPLYHGYKDSLEENGLASNGMLYRNAVDMLQNLSADELYYRRYIFIGFNMLTTAEIKIFSRLKAMERADFYWDFNSPALRMKESRAGRFMLRNMRDFPSLYQLSEEEITTLPQIEILGIPSNVGQVKSAGNILQRWAQSNAISNPANALDTAVVLPDESLFIPMLHSIPQEFTTVNVTMGMPMRFTAIASMMRSIVSLQLRSRTTPQGSRTYFFEDVKSLLNSPLIHDIAPEQCEALESEIQHRHLYNIDAGILLSMAPDYEPIFRVIDSLDDYNAVSEYLIDLCNFLEQNIDGEDSGILTHYLTAYRDAIVNLRSAITRFNIDIHSDTFIRLVERTINNDTIRFQGEPLQGLQIMGVLETRSLDFENIVMLSMNERVFPRRHYSRSFIPDTLRHSYGMSTIDFQESIYAYYFYRLISRAKRVALLYDARTVGGAKSSEMSRYLSQLLYFFNSGNVTHNHAVFSGQRFEPQPIEIQKDARILQLLSRFSAPDDGKNLSASALNTYINCPLEFYLRYVEGFDAENEITDYMDSSTYGRIVHETLENLYQELNPGKKDKSFTVESASLTAYLKPDDIKLDSLITHAINKLYLKRPDKALDTPLIGESLVLGKVIKATIENVVKLDSQMCPFVYVASEYDMKGRLAINDTLSINVRQFIDRIDRVGGHLRFVDYKTGSDELKTKSIAQLFDSKAPRRAKAIMQLMFYCHVYRCLNKDTQQIQPVIYKLLAMQTKGIEPLKVDGEVIEDYRDYYEEFTTHFNQMVESIFNPEVPFTQAPDDHACKFCNFKSICGRQ